MTETAEGMEAAQPKRAPELNLFADVIRSLTGKVVTMVNPQSLEDAPMGYQLTTGFYRAKIINVNEDFATVATELLHKGKETVKEPVKQFIPLRRIRRVTVAKSDILLHL